MTGSTYYCRITHYEVGKKVRKTIQEIGGTMPENLPVEESIKKVERKEQKKLKDKCQALFNCASLLF